MLAPSLESLQHFEVMLMILLAMGLGTYPASPGFQNHKLSKPQQAEPSRS